jgi:uncharacterized DUF497 family protein
VATVRFGDFEWDDEKAAANLKKHGVSFEEATTAVADPGALFVADHSSSEDRFQVLGLSTQDRVLLVVTVDRNDRERIISARRATDREREHYAATQAEQGAGD